LRERNEERESLRDPSASTVSRQLLKSVIQELIIYNEITTGFFDFGRFHKFKRSVSWWNEHQQQFEITLF
jgi:hypothetical protein